eukprot:1137731-Rhodomonas_salina.1
MHVVFPAPVRASTQSESESGARHQSPSQAVLAGSAMIDRCAAVTGSLRIRRLLPLPLPSPLSVIRFLVCS